MLFAIGLCEVAGAIPPVALARLLTDAIAPGTWVLNPALPVVGFSLLPSGGNFTTSPFMGYTASLARSKMLCELFC